MDEKEKRIISTTAFSFFIIFVVIAMIFIFGRQYIGAFNYWCLIMTGEVTPRPVDVNQIPEDVKIQQQQFQKANNMNKVDAPAQEATNQHVSRKTPAENGTYSTPETDKTDDSSIIAVGSNDKVVVGSNNWHGKEDLSFKVRLFRQEKGFLVVVMVTDDILWAENENVQHQNDCVEIYFDVRPPKQRGKDKYEPGVYHALIVPCFGMKKNANTMIFHFENDEPMPEGCRVKTNTTADGYRVEAFFPFTMFKYEPEDEFNFDIGVIDYDYSGNYSQMVWSGSSENYKGAMWFARMKPVSKKQIPPAKQ